MVDNIMEAPKPINSEIVMKIKENECPYTLTFCIESNSLVIKISEDDSVPSIHYSIKLTLTDLAKQSRYFRILDTLEEFMPELNNLCKENKIKLKKARASIDLILYLPMKVVDEVHLTIPQEQMDSKKVIADLCTTVNELKREIKMLKSTQITEKQLKINLQSKDILLNEDEKKMVCDWIIERMKSQGKRVNMTLLYKSTEHGDSSNNFHNLCNGKGYTLTLVRTTKGYRCGGFTTVSWSSYGNFRNDNNAFLFSLDFKEYYLTCDGSNAIYDHSSYGPTFGGGHDLYIVSGCHSSNSSCDFPNSYYGTRYRGLTGGMNSFKVKDVEVYNIETA